LANIRPIQKAASERLRIQEIKNPFECIVGRNAIGQWQKAFQPRTMAFAKRNDIRPSIGVANDGTNGDGNNIQQFVSATPTQAGITQGPEMFFQRNRGNAHDSPP
jgi:hypothetical protein